MNLLTQLSNQKARKPVILMSMGAQERGGHEYQVMTVKYIKPIVEHAKCVPILAPTCLGAEDVDQYLSMVDGVYLTGAATNIDPTLYGQDNQTPEKPQDRGRDKFDIPLILGALERGLPILAVCRGMQEINIALGGNLHQKLYTLPNVNDHRENGNDPVEKQYANAHKVKLDPASWVAKMLGKSEIPVNSLHGQSIDRLGKGVRVLGRAEDGIIEVIDLPDYPQFTLGVQWHPEWKAAQNPYSIMMYTAFGEACRQRVRDVSE